MHGRKESNLFNFNLIQVFKFGQNNNFGGSRPAYMRQDNATVLRIVRLRTFR